MQKVWFRAKKYGFGWYPASKEGWIATIVFGLYIAGIAYCYELVIEDMQPINNNGGLALFFLFVSALSSSVIAFTQLAYRRGEKPRWRWGRKHER